MGFSYDLKEICRKCFLPQEAFAKELWASSSIESKRELGQTKPISKTKGINFGVGHELEERR